MAGLNVHHYEPLEYKGIIALTVAGGVSFVSVVGLLLAITISGIRAGRSKTDNGSPVFIKTHVGIYLWSLLVCDLAQSVGSLVNIEWLSSHGVSVGLDCSTQAVAFQFGNVGTALWSFVIAAHTFIVLFVKKQVPDQACTFTVIGVWVFTCVIVVIGPAGVQTKEKGSFYGVTGSWCWITENYAEARLGLEYFWMFWSAFLSFILYFLIFLRLRGYITGSGTSMRFRCVKPAAGWNDRESVETYVLTVARQMLWYPVAYTFVILPIAACRWAEFSGKEVPFWASVLAGVIFALNGFINVVLYSTTRNVISKRPTLPTHTKSSHDMDVLHPSLSTHSVGSFAVPTPVKWVFEPPEHAVVPYPLPTLSNSPPPARGSTTSFSSEELSACTDCEYCRGRKMALGPIPILVKTPPTPENPRRSLEEVSLYDEPPEPSGLAFFPLTRF